MLTTAAWPEASRYFWPSDEKIQEPSPRTAVGKDFLKLRGKRAESAVTVTEIVAERKMQADLAPIEN